MEPFQGLRPVTATCPECGFTRESVVFSADLAGKHIKRQCDDCGRREDEAKAEAEQQAKAQEHDATLHETERAERTEWYDE